MGILSPSTSLTRYRVEGAAAEPLKASVLKGLKSRAISTVEDDAAETAFGWTSLENPFLPDFKGDTFVYGGYFAFSLRIDKKAIPASLIQKYVAIETARKLKASGREFLSRQEKDVIKDHVVNLLHLRVPSTPSVYNVLWNYETAVLCFFSNQKAAAQTFETLFQASFGLRLIRLFPYTLADLAAGLSERERDDLSRLSPAPRS